MLPRSKLKLPVDPWSGVHSLWPDLGGYQQKRQDARHCNTGQQMHTSDECIQYQRSRVGSVRASTMARDPRVIDIGCRRRY